VHGGEIAPYRYISGLVDMVIAIFWVENVHFKLVQKEAGLCELSFVESTGHDDNRFSVIMRLKMTRSFLIVNARCSPV
jgi:hypothetical protein